MPSRDTFINSGSPGLTLDKQSWSSALVETKLSPILQTTSFTCNEEYDHEGGPCRRADAVRF